MTRHVEEALTSLDAANAIRERAAGVEPVELPLEVVREQLFARAKEMLGTLARQYPNASRTELQAEMS